MAQPSQPNPAGVSAGAPGTAATVSNPTVKPTKTQAAGSQSLSVLQHLQNVGSDSNALKWILGTAAAGGLTGGLLSSQGGLRPGETPGQRRKRILLNVLGSAAAGGTIPAALFASKDFIGNEPDLHAPTARDKYNAMHGGFAASPLAKGLYSAAGGTYGYMKGKKMDYERAIGTLLGSKNFKNDSVSLEHATAGVKGMVAGIANAEKGSQPQALGQADILEAMNQRAGTPGGSGALRALRVKPIEATKPEGGLLSRLFHGQSKDFSPANGFSKLDRGRVGGVLGMTAGAMAPVLVNWGVNRGADLVDLWNNKETKAPVHPGIWDWLTHGKALNSD